MHSNRDSDGEFARHVDCDQRTPGSGATATVREPAATSLFDATIFTFFLEDMVNPIFGQLFPEGMCLT